MTLEAIRYRAGSLQILNQLLLPRETVYDEIRSVQNGYEAIKSMKVAPSPRALLLLLSGCHFIYLFICIYFVFFPPVIFFVARDDA